MYNTSAQFLQAIRGPHTAVSRVTAWRGGVDVTPAIYGDKGLPSTGGSVTVDSSSAVRRTLSITLADPHLSPTTAQDLLAPYGIEIHVERGIEYPSGFTEYVSLGWFRIDSDSLTISGQSGATEVSLSASGREAFIADARFWTTTQAAKGVNVVTLISGLVTAAMPEQVPPTVDLTGNTAIPRTPFTWDDHDRLGACTSMATGISAEFFCDADGTPTIRKVPVPNKNNVVWVVDCGPGGAMVEATPSVDRTNVCNSVYASSQTTDGTATHFGVATDDDPNSATFYGGIFGKKVRFYSSPILRDDTDCVAAATNILNRYKGAGWTISLSTLVNPALDAGDVIQVNLPDGRIQYHVVDQTVIPLDVTTAQTITTRSNDVQGDISE